MVVGGHGVSGILALQRVEVLISFEGELVTILHPQTAVLHVRLITQLAQKFEDVMTMIVLVSQT